VTVQDGVTGETETRTCKFLHSCAGYYNYDKGYQPDFPGAENFKGPMIHPQFWPEDLDYSDKKSRGYRLRAQRRLRWCRPWPKPPNM
jgi:cation diffusion facilitator CzcD-associated flavoprotein CzcO